MTAFSISTETTAAPERVWAVMSDVERWHEWTPSITSVSLLDAGALAIDSRVLVRQPKLPSAVWTVTAVEPGRGFTWVSRAPGVRIVATHQVEPVAGGSRATLSIDLEGVFASLFGLLTGRVTQRYMAMEAAGLKARSEQPDYRHGAAVRSAPRG
jgi:hypothetical protein